MLSLKVPYLIPQEIHCPEFDPDPVADVVPVGDVAHVGVGDGVGAAGEGQVGREGVKRSHTCRKCARFSNRNQIGKYVYKHMQVLFMPL